LLPQLSVLLYLLLHTIAQAFKQTLSLQLVTRPAQFHWHEWYLESCGLLRRGVLLLLNRTDLFSPCGQ